MQKEIYIRFKSGEKEAELNLVDFQPEHQLAMLDGVFKFFDIDVAFRELAQVSLHTRKAYLDFYEQTNETNWTETNEEPIPELVPEPVIEVAEPEIKEMDAPSDLVKQAEDSANWKIETTAKEETHWYTGIKVQNGIERYRLHYKCPSCGKPGNRYIQKIERMCECHGCRTKMMVKAANPNKELTQDAFGNFFIAGDFKTVLPI